MKRVHDTARAARYELMIAGYRPSTVLPNGVQPWARPGQPAELRVIRREVQGADERWVIEPLRSAPTAASASSTDLTITIGPGQAA